MGEKYSKYRWVMMILTAMPSVAVNISQYQFSAYTEAFMSRFSLTLTQFSAVVFSYAIFTGISGIFAGTLEDKFGVRKVVSIGGITATAASVVRIFTGSYGVFFAMSMLIGALTGAGIAAIARVSNAWFPEKERSLSVCVICLGGPAGVALGQLLAPLFPDYRAALIFSAVICAAVTLGWIFLGRDAAAEDAPKKPAVVCLKMAAKSKNVWLISLSAVLFSIFMFGSSNLMPSVLMIDKGMSEQAAVGATSLLNLVAVPGLIIMPLIQRKIGKYKPVLFLDCGVSIVCSLLLLIAPEWMVWVLTALIGFFGGTVIGFFVSVLPELKELGQDALGSANGILALCQYLLGVFLISSYVLTPMVDADCKTLYIADAVLCVFLFIIAVILPEVGEKSDYKKQ